MSASSFISLNQRMSPKKPFAGHPLRPGNSASDAFTPTPDSQKEPVKCAVRYRVDELLKGGREAVLLHRGQEYRLRITSTGKLILTK